MSTVKQFVKDLNNLSADLVAGIMAVESKSLATGLQAAHKFSSGTVPTSTLSTSVKRGGLGAPYGHGPIGWLGPRGAVPYGGDLGWINKQRGTSDAFDASWRTLQPSMSGGLITSTILNVDPIAVFLERGTVKMKARPIDDKIVAAVDKVRTKNLDAAIGKAFRKFK